MRKKLWWLVLLSIILIMGLGLRAYDFGRLPNGIYWDEVAMLVDAKSVSQTGRDMHGRVWYQVLYPSYGDYKLPVYIWLASLSVAGFGVEPAALRLPSLVAGMVTIGVAGAIAYLLIKQTAVQKKMLLPVLISLATMVVVATSPWSIMFSRTAFEGHLAQAVLALSVLTLLLGRRRRWWWLLSAGLGALATYTYFSVRFVWPPIFLAFAAYDSWNWLIDSSKKRWTQWLWLLLPIVMSCVLFVIALIPMVKSPLYQDSNRFRLGTDSVLKNEAQIIQSNVYREMAGNTSVDRLIFHRWWLTARELLLNYSDNLSPAFLFVHGDPNLRHGTSQFGLFYSMCFPFFIWGWYQLFDKHRGICLWLVVWWLVALLPASVPENTPHALRSLNALVPLSLVIGVGIGYTLDSAFQHWRKRTTTAWKTGGWGILISATLGLFIFQVFQFSYYYFTIYPKTAYEAWQYGYPQVADAIIRLREESPVYIESFDDKFYLWVMAEGPYTGQDFQSWQSFSYQFRSFDAIHFSPFPGWGSVLHNDSRVVVAGRTEAIDTLLAQQPMTVVKSENILDPQGNPLFKVVMVDKKL